MYRRRWICCRDEVVVLTDATTYRLISALLVGVAYTAVLALLLNLPSLLFVIPASLLLMPGGIVLAPFSHGAGMFPVLPMLGIDSAVYSAVAYLVICHWAHFSAGTLKRMAAVAILPTVVLACLACIPFTSPLWPRGMSQLAQEEKWLRDGLPVGSTIDSARALLASRKIGVYEEQPQSEQVVFQNPRSKIVAQAGDHVLWAHIPTNAGQFPCGFRIDVALVFGADLHLKQRYVERFAICP